MQKKLFFIFYLLLGLSSCQQYSESFQVIRKTSISAKIDDEKWTANDYLIRDLGKVVYYSDVSDREGQIFNRISIIGFNGGNSLESIERLEITLDVLNVNNILGTYSTVYDENGGINNIEWTESETDNGFFPFYTLCPASDATTEFIVERQHEKENLISGIFKTTLCERTNASDTVRISEGVFRDLEYSGN